MLNDKDAEFISYGCQNNHIKANFEPFIDLVFERDRVGDPLKLI